MGRRNHRAPRCAACRQHESLCLCAELPRLANRTRVLVVMHRIEARKSTNTGRLATLCLEQSAIFLRGDESGVPLSLPLDDGSRPILLFPHEDAEELSARHAEDGPVTLVVPDGNWRQASRMRKRVAGLADIPCVKLPQGAPSLYRLRQESRDNDLATAEAIARALAILESPELGAALEDALVRSVDRMLWARGAIDTGDVRGGLPEGVQRHAPTHEPYVPGPRFGGRLGHRPPD